MTRAPISPAASSRCPAAFGLLLGIALAPSAVSNPASAGDSAFFEAKIRPILAERCYSCHGAISGKAKGGLTLDTRDGIRKGGANGPAVVPGLPDESLILAALKGEDEAAPMPPTAEGRLTSDQVADFERWIKEGAEDPRDVVTQSAGTPKPGASTGEPDLRDPAVASKAFWAYLPVADPTPPPVRDAAWPRNEVDRFLLAAIEAKGLTPAPDADRRTLLRRVTFDLIGLPPTPEEVDAFLAEPGSTPEALARVVDRLLASPRYGERWGRHWLDLVRYADTSGCNSDYPIPQAARYRDWVIASLNVDLPYDKFLARQVAGDLLPAASPAEHAEGTIATGYLAIARRFGSQVNEGHLTIDDQIDNLGKVALGLSISCARCHDHKFDAIPQKDYYALYGILNSTRLTFPGIEVQQHPRDFVALGPASDAEALKAYETEVFEVEKTINRLKREVKTAAGVAKSGAAAKPGARPVEELRAELKTKSDRLRELEKNPPAIDKAYAAAEGKPRDAKIHKKGDPNRTGDEVRRGFLAVLGGQSLSEASTGSGRLELAAWLTDRANPLVARVMANRIWAGHFGRGIVASPNDFGMRGDRPSHPELLDWLASRLVNDGWSLKSLHRRIVLSHAYATAAEGDPKASEVDPNNALVSHAARRRLSAEEIRDALLAVSGQLDTTPPGNHPFPPEHTWRFTQHSPFVASYETNHRSVYLMQQRLRKNPYLDLFDGADPNATTPNRPTSTTPLQALYFLNDPFAHAQAKAFADRLVTEDPAGEAAQVERAYRLLLGRVAEPDEVALAIAYLDESRRTLADAGTPEADRSRAALASYARVLLSGNEFLHVD